MLTRSTLNQTVSKLLSSIKGGTLAGDLFPVLTTQLKVLTVFMILVQHVAYEQLCVSTTQSTDRARETVITLTSSYSSKVQGNG